MKSSSRRLPGACLALALGLAACAGIQTQESVARREAVEVRVLLFSGRPDPSFVLPESAHADLARILGRAREDAEFRGESVHPSRLGYKGFLISNPARLSGLPLSVGVFREHIELPGKPQRLLVDDGALENWLIEQAQRAEVLDDLSLEQVRKR
jgi:hypothetical protein